MKRYAAVLAGLALALSAAPSSAQAPYEDVFTFGGRIDGDAQGSTPVSPYNGSLTNTALNDNLVWCVDLTGSRNWSGDAWVTSMSQNDFSKTERGNDYRNSYRWSAYFASQMDWYTGYPNPLAVPASNAYNDGLQYVMWHLLGYTPGLQTLAQANAFLASNFATLGTIADLQGAGPDLDFFDYRKWVVITSADCLAGTACDPDRQEYIGLRPGDPTSVVPEPATMTLLATGLAGMAAASRRRKQA